MNIAIIPARGGSKRIPRKNSKLFAGKPIIAYSIENALESGCFDRVVVSTDCPLLAQIAVEYGAEVPFMRPYELASDTAGTLPVVVHALTFLECQSEQDFACVIYPTAPLLTAQVIRQSFDKLRASEKQFVFSAARFAAPIQRAFYYDDQQRITMFQPEQYSSRSQDLTVAYHDAGQFYWGRASAFCQNLDVLSHHSELFVLPPWQVIDIDEPADWDFAEKLYHIQQGQDDA